MSDKWFCVIRLVALAVISSVALSAQAQFAKVNGHALYFEIHGKGRPVVLLHGGGSNIEDSFAAQLNVFSQQHEVIAIEQVGQGHSPDVPGALSYSLMMNDTAALLTQLGRPQYDLVGWSDGAIVALMLAVHHPELVRRVVATGANISPNGLTAESLQAIQNDSAPAIFHEPEQDESLAAEENDPAHTAVLAEKLRTLWLTSPTPDQLSPALLQTVHKPVLVMAGDRDEIRLEHSILIYRSLPNAQLWIVPGTGHATLSQRPEWFNSVVMLFLDKPGVGQ